MEISASLSTSYPFGLRATTPKSDKVVALSLKMCSVFAVCIEGITKKEPSLERD